MSDEVPATLGEIKDQEDYIEILRRKLLLKARKYLGATGTEGLKKTDLNKLDKIGEGIKLQKGRKKIDKRAVVV